MPTKPRPHLQRRPARPAQSFSLAEVLGIAAVGLLAGGAFAYLVVDRDDETLHGLARVLGAVSLTGVLLLIMQGRQQHQIDEIKNLLDERLERERRWNAMADALNDLSGIDPNDSGDISFERNRRRR